MTENTNYDIINEAISSDVGSTIVGGGEIFNDYQLNEANGMLSHSEGEKTKAQGRATHAEGCESVANYTGSHAEGISCSALGHGAHAENFSSAEGNYSHAEGHLTKTTGDNSHSEGRESLATGLNSHAEGQKTTASGTAAHAEGYNTTASGEKAHAEGIGTVVSGAGSHAEGSYTVASGDNSHAEGERTRAEGANSFAGGLGTISGHNYQTAIGTYNDNKSYNLFEVGNGTSDTNRSNAFEVGKNGTLCIGGKTITPSQFQKLIDYYGHRKNMPIPLSLDESRNATLKSSADETWFKYTPKNEDEEYVFYTIGNLDTVGYLYEGETLLAQSDDNEADANLRIKAKLTYGKTYYLCVKGKNGAYGNFGVKVNAFANLPNGSCKEKAITASLGSQINGSFLYPNEAMWYKFTSNATEAHLNGDFGEYTVSQANLSYANIILYDSNGRQLQEITKYQNKFYPIELPYNKTYYLCIKPHDKDVTEYSFKVSYTNRKTMLQNAFANATDKAVWMDTVSIDDEFDAPYDSKWYKITAVALHNHVNNEPGEYYFSVFSDCSTVTVIYTPNGTEMARHYNSPTSSENTLTCMLESGGVYYVCVRSLSTDVASFTFEADFERLPYEGTAKESAILLTYGRNYDDAISSAGESRWYKYTANRAELHNNGAENAYTVAAYGIPGMIAEVTDSNGNPVTILQQDVFGSEFGYTFEMNLGDTYYFRVIAPNNYTGEYYIWISSNNTYYNTGSSMSDAIVLPFNSWVQGSIDTAKQSKWYKFTVTEHCDKVTVQSKSDIRVEGVLYDMNGARIASDNDYPDPDDFITPTDFVICEPLTVGYSYYICVTGKTNETGSFKLLASDKIPVEEVVVSPATKEIAVGSTYKLTASVYPSNATDKSLKWYSGNDAVATVNSSGVVTAKGTAPANIYAASKDGSNKLDYCVVTVKPNAASVTISPSNLTMNVGETKTLTAIVSPSNVYDSSVTWSSSDSNIATVDKNGKVTAKSVGTARITAKSKNGLLASSYITINPLLIYQTRNTETKWFGESDDDNSESVRPDLSYNHMTKEEIMEVPKISILDFVKKVTTPTGDAYYPKTLDDYRTSFLQMVLFYFCNEEFEPIAEDMIKHFMCEDNSNFQGVVDDYNIYKNNELTQLVEGHEKSKEYVNNIKNALSECLKEFGGDIYALRYYPSMRFAVNDRLSLPFVKKIKEQGYDEPSFHSDSDKLAGYTICLDSLHGNKVEVTSYSKVDNSYTGNLKFTYYDHFGLDKTDMEGYKNLNDVVITALSGFHDWFILQHWNDLPATSHPKPFITMIEFEIPFSGKS